MGLPVLRLPHVVFDNVYRFLKVPDKILFSQCSRRTKAIVKSKESPPRNEWELSLTIDKKFSLYLRKRTFCRSSFQWDLETNENPQPEADNKSIRNDGAMIGTRETTSRVTAKEWKSVVKQEFYEVKILAMVQLFKEIFNCLIDTLTWRNRISFRKLIMETDALHHAREVDIYNGIYEPEEVDFVFDSFTASIMEFRAESGPGYSYHRPLKPYKIFLLEYANWIDLEKVLKLVRTAYTICLDRAELISDKDLNRFIKWWMGSDYEDLRVIFIKRRSGEMDRDVIMEAIPSTPGREKLEDAIPYCDYYIDECYKDGLDIRRKDGVQATVIVEESFFALGVLQLPNPNVEELTDN